MHNRLNVLVAGRSRDAVSHVEALLEGDRRIAVTTRYIGNGRDDPLDGQPRLPDALVLVLGEGGQTELAALMDRPATQRPPLLVVGPGDDKSLLRTAMRAGARDFLEAPVDATDLAAFIAAVSHELADTGSSRQAQLTAVINAKGGSGASMVAANLARQFAAAPERRTLLVDMDIQFGALPLYFNLNPVNGLIQALETVDALDPVALKGYVLSHDSGLDVLASAPNDLLLSSDVPEHQVDQLLRVLGEAYDDVVVDLPRWIGESMAAVLERADRILVVIQQSVAHLRDAKRMVHILQREMGVASERILVVINRFDKRSPVTRDDIREALVPVSIATLPNDFRHVSESINLGTPLLDLAPRAEVTRQLERLASSINTRIRRAPGHDGLWRRLIRPRS